MNETNTHTFIRGDTDKEGLKITWQSIDTGARAYEDIEFNDYFYILIDDFHEIKDSLKERWGKYLKAVVQFKANDEFDNPNIFAKIILADNTKKYLIRMWLDEEKNIKHYEIDLNTTKRYLVDNHKSLNLNLLKSRYLFYDIETDDRKYFKYDEFNKIIPENTILSFAAIDHKGEKFFFINENAENPECEKKLLAQIRDLCMKYSIISGWNSSGFDDVYLAGRAQFHKMEDFTKKINLIDYMFSYKKYRIEISQDNYKLDYIGEIELGEKKVEVKKGGGRLYNLYLTDKEKLKEYNIQDVVLLYKLNKKLKFIELHLQTAHLGSCNIQLTNYNIGSNDYFILMRAKDRNLITPSQPSKEEKGNRKKMGSISGGYTRGESGLYDKVIVYDYSSLYPSLEITYNISPETYVGNVTIEEQKQYLEKKHNNIKCFKNYEELKKYCKEKNYIHTPSDLTYVAKQGKTIYHPFRLYKGDKIGLLPSIMIELIEKRYEVKKRMKLLDRGSEEYDRLYNEQLAYKYMLNSNYGLNALPAYRYYIWDVADSITTSGRVNTKKVRAYARKNKFKVVYSDTDSVGISPTSSQCPTGEEFDKMLSNFMDGELKEINNNVYKREDNGVLKNHRLILELEKTYTPLLYKKKKRYCGLVKYKNGEEKIDITGLESTQMNVLAAKLQKDFISDVLTNNFNPNLWKLKMKHLYEDCFSGRMKEENLYITKKFTARASEQKAPRAHTMLAERMIEKGEEIFVGDKIKYIVESVKPKQHAVTPEEFRMNGKYPVDYYWNLFIKPLVSLMGILKNVNVMDIIKIPDIEKLENKLIILKNKEGDNDEKIIKLIERIKKLKDKWLDETVNEEELNDVLFTY